LDPPRKAAPADGDGNLVVSQEDQHESPLAISPSAIMRGCFREYRRLLVEQL
jgi:hypothetical protein